MGRAGARSSTIWATYEEVPLEGFPELRTDGLCGIPWCKWGKLPVMSTVGVVIRHHELAYGGNVHLRDVLTLLLSYEIGAKKKAQSLVGQV